MAEEPKTSKKAVNLPTKGVQKVEDSISDEQETKSDPSRPQNFGFWNDDKKLQIKNACVLVVHYAFAGQSGDRSDGDSKDVENLRRAFEVYRNCKFKALSPRKSDFNDILNNKASREDGTGKLQEIFGLQRDETPDVFALFILSHGHNNGVIETENAEKIILSEVFDSMKSGYLQDCLKLVFVSACRGSILDMALNLDKSSTTNEPLGVRSTTVNMERDANAEAVAIKLEPNTRNFVIVYSTVETTYSIRLNTGTLLIKALCKNLNNLDRDLELEVLLTRTMNYVHEKSMKYSFGCTPQVQIFAHKKLIISKAENENMKESSANYIYDWTSVKGIYMSKREAHIFCRLENKATAKDVARIFGGKFGFSTEIYDEYHKMERALRGGTTNDSGCVLMCVLAPLTIDKDTGDIGVAVRKSQEVTVQDFQYNFISDKNKKWVGKPKICIFVHHGLSDSDTMSETEDTLQFAKCGTFHSGYLTLMLPHPDSLNLLLEELEGFDLQSGTTYLQQVFMNIIRKSKKLEEPCIEPQYWSTLQYSLDFPKNQMLLQPTLQRKNCGLASRVTEFLKKYIRKMKKVIMLDSKGFMPENEEADDVNTILIVSALPGTGKTLLTSHLAYKLRQIVDFVTEVELVKEHEFLESIDLSKSRPKDFVEKFNEAREERRDFQEGKEIILLDGFDGVEVSVKEDMLEMIRMMADAKIPLWITTRPHDEQLIKDKLNGIKFEVIGIDEISPEEQKKLFTIKLGCTYEESELYLDNIRKLGAEDLLTNPSILSKVVDFFIVPPNNLRLADLCNNIVTEKITEEMQNREGIGGNTTFPTQMKKRLESLKLNAIRYFAKTSVDDGDEEEVAKINGLGFATVSNKRISFISETLAQFFVALHVTSVNLEDEEFEFSDEEIAKIVQADEMGRCRRMIEELREQISTQ